MKASILFASKRKGYRESNAALIFGGVSCSKRCGRHVVGVLPKFVGGKRAQTEFSFMPGAFPSYPVCIGASSSVMCPLYVTIEPEDRTVDERGRTTCGELASLAVLSLSLSHMSLLSSACLIHVFRLLLVKTRLGGDFTASHSTQCPQNNHSSKRRPVFYQRRVWMHS